MALKVTQFYLTEAEHAALQRAADRAGKSMTAIIRDLIDRHLLESEPPPTDLTGLIGVVGSGKPSDISVDKDARLEEELLADLRRRQRPLRAARSR
jgi:hypothetical protein